MATLCLHGYVQGRVQGVYFRQSTQVEAQRLGLDGWVRNLEDGRVEVWLEGEADAVRELAAWLEHGPQAARVDGLELQPQDAQGFSGFQVRR
jgi:acylphosphatase